MIERMRLVENLRSSLKDGATPSRLIRDILAQWGDSISYREVQEILREAFQLPIVRLGPSLSYRKGILNQTLLAEIVQNRKRWEALIPGPVESFWLDGLQVADPEEVKQRVTAGPYPGLSKESWAALRPDEREALFVQLASGIVLSERVELLARLAERLQQKVDELQDRLNSPKRL